MLYIKWGAILDLNHLTWMITNPSSRVALEQLELICILSWLSWMVDRSYHFDSSFSFPHPRTSLALNFNYYYYETYIYSSTPNHKKLGAVWKMQIYRKYSVSYILPWIVFDLLNFISLINIHPFLQTFHTCGILQTSWDSKAYTAL